MISYVQYVLGIFGRARGEVIFLKNEFLDDEVSDLSLYSSKVI